jgi:hypothetical protein
MVPDISPARLLMLFTEGLLEPLRGWVKAFKPPNLQDAIWRTRDLMGSTTKAKFTPRPPINQGEKDQRGMDRGKGRMDEATRRELRRKQLCFTCKEPWEPGHKCMGKGKVHYIEVISDDEEEEEMGHIHNMEANQPSSDNVQGEEGEETYLGPTGEKKITIASISGVPKYNTFRMRGVLQGQKVYVLIDGGASHNFIDSTLVKRRHIPTVEFEGFCVEVAGGNTMPCDRYIPGLSLTLGRYDLAQEFYVMDLPDTNVILGVQWLSTLGPITTNYKTMEMSFNGENGKRVTLRGMTGNAPKVVTTKCMEAIFRREDIVYATECLISVQVDKEGHPHYSHDIQKSLTVTTRFLNLFHQDHHQIGGLSIL